MGVFKRILYTPNESQQNTQKFESYTTLQCVAYTYSARTNVCVEFEFKSFFQIPPPIFITYSNKKLSDLAFD